LSAGGGTSALSKQDDLILKARVVMPDCHWRKVLTTATGFGESKRHLCLPTSFVQQPGIAYEKNFPRTLNFGHFGHWHASAIASDYNSSARFGIAAANSFADTRGARAHGAASEA